MSVHHTLAPVVLEPAAQAFADAPAEPPFLYELTPADARGVLDGVQATPIDKLPVEDRWIIVPAVVFVEYDRSPEGRYPVAIEQGYATAQWITREGAANDLDPDRVAVAGDSVGGNMTAALTLMAEERGDVRFVHQSGA